MTMRERGDPVDRRLDSRPLDRYSSTARSVVAEKASGFLIGFWIFAQAAAAQKGPTGAVADPFIAAVEAIKHSVGSMDCLEVNGEQAKMLKRIGSAFLISESGDFLTAAHVVEAMQKSDDPCPTPAITMTAGEWRPELPAESMFWFPFQIADCRIESALDVAKCRPSGDLPARIRRLHKAIPVRFEWNIQPDGAQLAFTGFPLEARDPMTFRAHVAAYRTRWPDQSTPEVVLDHGSLPGFSGSPVFLADGKVVAILVRDGKPDAPGIAIARPVSVVRKLLAERPPD
jgi:hypothetical protein